MRDPWGQGGRVGGTDSTMFRNFRDFTLNVVGLTDLNKLHMPRLLELVYNSMASSSRCQAGSKEEPSAGRDSSQWIAP